MHCFLLFHLLPFSLHFILLSITVYVSAFVCLACNVFLQISVLSPLRISLLSPLFLNKEVFSFFSSSPIFFVFNTLLRLAFSSLCYMSLLS